MIEKQYVMLFASLDGMKEPAFNDLSDFKPFLTDAVFFFLFCGF
mgnify:CR=1 FL=1